jgi:hypothetical protein
VSSWIKRFELAQDEINEARQALHHEANRGRPRLADADLRVGLEALLHR